MKIFQCCWKKELINLKLVLKSSSCQRDIRPREIATHAQMHCESVFRSEAANKKQGLTHLDVSPSSLINNRSSLQLSLPRSHILPSCQLHSQRFSYSVWHIHRVCEHSSELFNPCNTLNWKTAKEHHRGSQLSGTIIPLHPTTAPPLVTEEHIRQRAGLVDEKKFTNCLIIQIFMIMNRYSTVREHGVQPELPPQHSSCESWLLISGWLSGTNNSDTPFKFPSCVFYCMYL